MCGIAGLYSDKPVAMETLRRMTNALSHRGPDDEGQWLSSDRRMALGQRRLAIIDLSPAGHQPMVSVSGRYVIDFNGEIYNYRDIRKELEEAGKAPKWRGHSDTEVLLAAIECWGLEASLRRLAGMFAFALWDETTRDLTLVRDRFGEKPLYYGRTAEGLAFASELKAIGTLPGFSRETDRMAVRCLLAVGYIPAPLTIFRGFAKLEPGHRVKIVSGGQIVAEAAPESWYDYAAVMAAGLKDPFTSREAALAELEPALEQAVERQLVADVPVGAFLSGGVDSSLITALAAKKHSGPLKTFSIGFDEAGFDEAPFARAVASHLGTDHHESYVSAAQVRDIVPLMPFIYDEPFGDSSQLPTYLVSKFAREHVTVSLSGDAGDEIFGGYNRYRALPATWSRIGGLPSFARRALLGPMAAISPAFWNMAGSAISRHRRPDIFGHKVQRGLRLASRSDSFGDLFSRFLDEWDGWPSPVVGVEPDWQSYMPFHGAGSDWPLATQLMHTDAVNYLPGDILVKTDRAAMAVSLEGRIPFLDLDLVAIAARIPASMNIEGSSGKQMLREILYRHVPRNLIERPKAGFAIPVGEWLKGPLREWCEDLLSPAKLAQSGYMDAAPIRKRWEQHLQGMDATQALWPILMLQSWRAHWDSEG